ncbi:MAG: Fe-S cluster assembly sulfur transfer protein SufU [Acidobacteriota bacterium]
MSDLKQLYQEIILDHYRSPRNHGGLEAADREAAGHNPLCGDRVKIFVGLDGDRIEDITFEGDGCAISTASASLLTEAIKGKTIPEAESLGQNFRDLLTGQTEPGDHDLGKLEAFVGVRDLPVRIKCATLAWHTLKAALDNGSQTVTTEN